MYTAHAKAGVEKMKNSVTLIREFSDLILATHSYLHN